jgi:cell division protein FtsI (penicillin-binding protein 3)
MNQKELYKQKVYFSIAIFSLLFFVIFVKAFYVQIINYKKLQAYAKSQYLRKDKSYPFRGSIYDRNNNLLALNRKTYSIFALPKLIKNKVKTAKDVKKIIPQINHEKILKLIKKRKKYTWIARKIRIDDKKIKELKKIKGIYVDSNHKRYYPNAALASQLIGFVGVDNKGLSGVEYYKDEVLRGKEKIIQYIKDARGRPIKFENFGSESKSKDIILSIDKEYQAILEKYLALGVETSKAKSGGAGIMDANTGEVLAMANYPTYNPNNRRSSNVKNMKLSFISDPFEPGSIFKIITVASGLESGIIKKDTNYFCEYGKMKIDNHIVTEAEVDHGHEWLSVEDIIVKSSNIGVTKIAYDLTYKNLYKTMKKFGVGVKTKIQLPGESRGILTKKRTLRNIELSNISFGQGIATTAIQMLKAYSIIANGGYDIQASIIKKDQILKQKRIFKKTTVIDLENMLKKVTINGTGKNARIPSYDIAGKTGTAQKANKEGGYTNKYISSFIGYPTNIDKKMVLFVYVDTPTKNYYGNIVAAPIFNKIMSAILYKENENPLKEVDYKNISNKNNEVIWDKINISQSSLKSLSKNKIPSFRGLDKLSARKIAQKLKIKTINKGIGIVISQSIKAGTKIKKGMLVKLNYEEPKFD